MSKSATKVELPHMSGQTLRDKVRIECRGRYPFIGFRNSQVDKHECHALADEMGLDFIEGERSCGFYQKTSNIAERLAAKRKLEGTA